MHAFTDVGISVPNVNHAFVETVDFVDLLTGHELKIAGSVEEEDFVMINVLVEMKTRAPFLNLLKSLLRILAVELLPKRFRNFKPRKSVKTGFEILTTSGERCVISSKSKNHVEIGHERPIIFRIHASDADVTAKIIAALEGPIAITECVAAAPGTCDQESLCSVRANWQMINRTVHGALDKITLSQMIRPAPDFERWLEKAARGGGTSEESDAEEAWTHRAESDDPFPVRGEANRESTR